MRVRWLSSAARTRSGQIGFIAQRNPRAAIDVGERIRAATALLRRHPALGRPGRVPGTRELVVSRTHFILVYRIEPDGVVVLTLLHGAQDWPGPT